MQLEHPSMDIHKEGKYLMLAIQELLSGDQCEGRFVFGRYSKKPIERFMKELGLASYTDDGRRPITSQVQNQAYQNRRITGAGRVQGQCS